MTGREQMMQVVKSMGNDEGWAKLAASMRREHLLRNPSRKLRAGLRGELEAVARVSETQAREIRLALAAGDLARAVSAAGLDHAFLDKLLSDYQ